MSPDEVLALSIDELSLRILSDVVQAQERNEKPNEDSWLKQLAASSVYQGQVRAVRACAEAWGWLRSKGLVARDPGQSFDNGWCFITRRGEEVLASGLGYLRAVERLDIDLLPVLEQKARPQFLRGDFETAVLVAFKEVEVQVREKLGGSNLLGVRLMREAFGEGKPLATVDADGGEVVARMELYAGAVGLFKNPTSHRPVDYASPTEAAEVVLLADLLLRLLHAES